MKDGHLNKCKECTKKDTRANRAANLDYYREYDRGRAMLPHRVQARSEYKQTDRGKAVKLASCEKWAKNNVAKRKAHHAVNNAVRDGRLIKPDNCESCGATGLIHGHHPDYSKPLEVEWLCPKCHSAAHKHDKEAA